jgi:hypothetical protein
MRKLTLAVFLAMIVSVTLLATTASDDFAGSGALSGSWTAVDGTIQRTSGQAEPAAFGGRQQVFHGTSFTATQFSKAIIGTGSATGGYDSFLTVRNSGAGGTHDGYGLRYGDSVSGSQIIFIEDSAVTSMQNLSTSTAAGDEMCIEVSGTGSGILLKAYKNGAQVGTDETIGADPQYDSGAVGFGGHFVGYDMFASWEGGDGGCVGGGAPAAAPRLTLLGSGLLRH